MDDRDKVIASMLIGLYYMMGLVEALDCKASYDFVLESMANAENLLFGEAL